MRFTRGCANILSDTLDDATIPQCHAGSVAFASGEIPGSISMHGLPQSMPPDGVGIHPTMHMYRGDSPGNAVENGNHINPYVAGYDNYANHYKEYGRNDDQQSHAYQQQWRHDAGHQYPPAHAYSDSSHYSSSLGAFSNDPSAHLPLSHSVPQNAPTHMPRDESFRASPFEAIPDSWKGEGKQELLETLLRTIGSCDEERVDQVVQVVRSSATPEDAVSGICQVLGISTR